MQQIKNSLHSLTSIEKSLLIRIFCNDVSKKTNSLRNLKDISYFAIEPGEVSSSIITDKGFSVLQKSVEYSEEWNNKFDFVPGISRGQ